MTLLELAARVRQLRQAQKQAMKTKSKGDEYRALQFAREIDELVMLVLRPPEVQLFDQTHPQESPQ